jgi:hypothetical protein
LRRLAAAQLARERPRQTLEATCAACYEARPFGIHSAEIGTDLAAAYYQ